MKEGGLTEVETEAEAENAENTQRTQDPHHVIVSLLDVSNYIFT